jgi:prolyl 4-hydroxylase
VAGVRERLLANPSVMQVAGEHAELFVARDFLNPQECAALIRRIDAERAPSRIVGDNPDPGYRTSETCNLDPHAPLTREIEARIGGLLGLDPKFGETIQGQRYAAGQQFKPHHDYFEPDSPHWPEQERMGGQRTWTAMIFLGGPERGGQTVFPHARLRISPRDGNLLAWNNLTDAGEGNPYTLHQGAPVEAGTKYIITKWFRERRWGLPA